MKEKMYARGEGQTLLNKTQSLFEQNCLKIAVTWSQLGWDPVHAIL